MSNILIADLAESVALDREAMAAITGGARIPRAHFERSSLDDSRIFSYPPGFAHLPAKPDRKTSPRTKALK
jgi:hypothetical protein